MNTYNLIIDGQPVATPVTLSVINPADETTVAACAQGSPEYADQAVAAARRAFLKWSTAADSERTAKLNAIADLIEKNQRELAELVTREQGKTQSGPGAHFELGGAAAWTRATASLTLPDQVIQDDRAGRIVAHRKPVGVVGSITPWNVFRDPMGEAHRTALTG
jgi:acyl-CoA reductase-like NAD-dependent aldehyde dehydrogenase